MTTFGRGAGAACSLARPMPPSHKTTQAPATTANNLVMLGRHHISGLLPQPRWKSSICCGISSKSGSALVRSKRELNSRPVHACRRSAGGIAQSIVGARRPVYFPWDLTTGRLLVSGTCCVPAWLTGPPGGATRYDPGSRDAQSTASTRKTTKSAARSSRRTAARVRLHPSLPRRDGPPCPNSSIPRQRRSGFSRRSPPGSPESSRTS